MRKTYIVLALAGAFCATTLQASLVNTGIDSDANGIDDNWTVGTYAGGDLDAVVQGDAYLLTTGAGNFPTPPWLADNAVSKWITPHTPTQILPGAGMWLYETWFQGAASTLVRWASDNQSVLYVNGTIVGSRPALDSFSTWNAYVNISPWLYVDPNEWNLVRILVNNPTWPSSNPTGVRLEAVPEPATVIAGALLLLPFGASAVRILRKNRVA